MMIEIVFLDLRKAFELLDRNILLKKLERYGIKGVVFSLRVIWKTERKE